MSLTGTAWISGAGHGIGRGVALAFAKAGCTRMTLVDIDLNYLHTTRDLIAQSYPSVSLDLQAHDLRQPDQVAAAVNTAAHKWGTIDYAANVAGIMGPRLQTCDMSLEVFDSVVNLNLRGTWMCEKALLQQMMKQNPRASTGQRGAIVNIASLMGVLSMDGPSSYVASKHAVIGLTRADADAYGPYGIRVNSICPGLIDSDFSDRMPVGDIEGFMAPLIKRTPLRRA